MPKTAKGLGTSTEALAQMSPEDQLDYVEKYLAPYKGKIGTLKDAYMACCTPRPSANPSGIRCSASQHHRVPPECRPGSG